MPKRSKSSYWLDIITKIIDVFLKSSRSGNRKKTHHQHVVPHTDGWAVRAEGNKRVTAVYKYQEQAIRKAKRIAKKYKADVIIHRKDGTIRDRIGYD
jgi:uncharacterized protein YdaT